MHRTRGQRILSMMRNLLKPVALVGAAALIALAALELFLRATGFSSPAWYQADADLGWALRPGASGWFSREGEDAQDRKQPPRHAATATDSPITTGKPPARR